MNDKLHNWLHLQAARPHALSGLHSKLAASIAMHNFCMWLDDQLGRARLAFADLLDW